MYRSEGKNFSAGADIKEQQKKLSKLQIWKSNLGKEAIESILKINQITIASLRGYCLGGAACIATACDFRVASETTLVAYPEIDLGMNLNWFGLPLLLRLIGPSKTKKMVISGEIENANDLFQWGFIDELFKDEELDKKTIAFAKKAVDEGADGLILVCAGAGGHAGTLSPFALVREVREFFDGPIALSGSISEGSSVLSAQALGADYAYIGTRFIATKEANASPGYKQMIVDSAANDIMYSLSL